MRIKHGSIALILIQLFVISTMVGALSPTVSAAHIDANTTTSHPDFLELPAREEVGFDWFDRADRLKPEFVPGEVVVKFRQSIIAGLTSGIVTTGIASVDELNKRFEAKGAERVFANIYRLTLPKDVDVLSVAREYEADPNVEYTEPNFICHSFFVPDDPNYTLQWAHQKIESEYAWNVTIGDPSILVAVIDSGIDYNHSDLVDNYVALGYDWVNNDNDTMDDFGHGTHCAGIIAATINNNKGIVGLAQVRIMAEKFLDSIGRGLASDAVNAIIHAVDQGADILSNSWGGAWLRSKLIHDAVEYAHDNGVLVVAAAGNEASSVKNYPAAYDEVVAVTATDQSDSPASFTSYGNWVDVAAPGVDIYSTVLNNRYENMNGTSMACPHAAGVAALIWSEFPNLTPDEVRLRLQLTADDLGDPGFDIYYGYGRVNARRAVEPLRSHDLLISNWKRPTYLRPGSSGTIDTTVVNFGSNNETGITVQLRVNGSVEDSAYISYLESMKSVTVSCTWSPTVEGKYFVESYVVPVSNETLVENNVKSAYIDVIVEKVIRVPEDFSRIQEAVDFANPGDTIKVAPGIYYENVDVTKPLTLVGENRSTTIIDGSGGLCCIDVEADNVNISGFTLRNRDRGVRLRCSNNNSISDNTILNNGFGIWVESSNNNSISENTVLSNHPFWAIGIWLIGSDSNFVSDNIVSSFSQVGDGICLDFSNNNLISGNTISNNTHVGISIDYVSELFDVRFSSYDNTICHNIFINNTCHAYSYVTNNTWDDCVAIGNHWDDYREKGGYDRGDGIGEPPYNITSNNQDNYPVMNPWNPKVHDVAVTNVTASDTRYGLTEVYPGWTVTGTPGWTVTINVTVKNYGFVENVNVTCYYNDTIIETQENVTLYPGVNRTLTFIWNATGVDSGSSGKDYTIKAEVSTVLGETDTDDNTMVDGTIRVKIFGDVDNNGVVDIGDVLKVRLAADGIIEEPRADLNYDGDVDDEDVSLVKLAYSNP